MPLEMPYLQIYPQGKMRNSGYAWHVRLSVISVILITQDSIIAALSHLTWCSQTYSSGIDALY